MPVAPVGAWEVAVGPGAVFSHGRTFTVSQRETIAVPPTETRRITDECHAGLPVFNPGAGGWRKGSRLRQLITEETTAPGLLDPDSVRVKTAPGGRPGLARGVDWEMDPHWGTVGRLEGGAIERGQAVYVDYAYVPCRLDAIAVDASGRPGIVPGEPGVGDLPLPEVSQQTARVASVWLSGPTEALTPDHIYPVDFAPDSVQPDAPPLIRGSVPRTLAKLRAGEAVRIVAWGDSVTAGGGVNHDPNAWYQHQLAALLAERFPDSSTSVFTAGWGGASMKQYLDAPAGGPYDFERDVLGPEPDLVTIEFVNDASLDPAGVAAQYGPVVDRIRAAGAEVVLLTPHFVRQDWMQLETGSKVFEDPRPYVAGLRAFADAHGVALADASVVWGQLARRGIPYMTLLANSINHPDTRGHRIFAEVLLELFPAP